MRQVFICLICLICCSTLPSCAKQKPLRRMEHDEAYRYLVRKYDQGKYLDAAEGFDYLTLNYSGAANVDSAQYLLAWSNYNLKKYILAASLFEELTQRFQRSRLVPEARFMVGVCYFEVAPKYALDQDYTYKSLDAFQAFIDYHPDWSDKVAEAETYIAACRSKLAHKTFANGMIYLKMKDWRAAGIYFREVVEQFYDTEYAAASTYRLGQALARQNLNEEAADIYQTYLRKYPDHDYAHAARQALEDCKLKIAN